MENNEEILKKISSGDPEAIAEAVDTVKENGDLVIAGKLLDILSQPLAPSTITIIANLLADIKDNQFKDLLIQKLEQTSEGTLKKELLRIVWESSLDYSSYLDHFLQILPGPSPDARTTDKINRHTASISRGQKVFS